MTGSVMRNAMYKTMPSPPLQYGLPHAVVLLRVQGLANEYSLDKKCNDLIMLFHGGAYGG